VTADVNVVFLPSGLRRTVSIGSTVLDAAREAGVDLDSVCGGRGLCGRCQIEVGDVAALSAPGTTERDYRGKRPLVEGHRLGCASRILSDVVIDVPSDSQVHHQVIRKRAEVPNIGIDPVVRLYYVEIDEPLMADPARVLTKPGDEQELLAEALEREWGLVDLQLDVQVTSSLHSVLEASDRAVTVAVHDGSHVSALWPGFRDRAWGVAFDVGTTTIAGHLCDLVSGEVLASAGAMNPQIPFGEDVMSRVSYAMFNEGGAKRLTSIVRRALDEMIAELVAAAEGERVDVLEVALVGNSIMHHLVLGFDPAPLGTAPFALATDRSIRIKATDAGLAANPGARLYALPCIAGHVGADAAAAILSEGPHRGEAIQLLVDIGTNAEIVLGSNSTLLAASSPTGPAFEGAQISGGQRATRGAIERVRIDRDTLEPRYKVIGCDLWSDEPGYSDRAPAVTGICGSGIVEVIAELFAAGVISRDGVIDARDHPRLIPDGRTMSYVLHEPSVHVTQSDVRAIQLAKAALYAGCRLLMDELGVDRVDEIRLAGAFGSNIDAKYAMAIGLIPDCDLDRVSAAGNAAGTGAMMALLSATARAEIEQVVQDVHKIETAIEPRFQDHFIDAMAMPRSAHRVTNEASATTP